MERFLTLESSVVLNSSHRLTKVCEGHKCSNLHGHRWKVDVKMQALVQDVPEDGMLMDFGVIKDFLRTMDHALLNDFVENPTCENLCVYIADEIGKRIPEKVELSEVAVEESPGNVVRWSR